MAEKKKPIKNSRPSWDEVFMAMAKVMSKRGACKYHEIASVFVDEDHKVVATGYNGPTVGDDHCLDVGCAKVDGDPKTGKIKRCRGAHSEINAIMNAGNPTKLKNSTLYITTFPCYDCMKALNNIGTKRIVYLEEYKRIKEGGKETEVENEARELAEKRGIELDKFSGSFDSFKNIFGEEKSENKCSCDEC